MFASLLEGLDKVSMFNFNPKGDIVPHRNIIFVPDAHDLISYLVNNGVGARTLFMPMHSQPCYMTNDNFSITEKDLFVWGKFTIGSFINAE